MFNMELKTSKPLSTIRPKAYNFKTYDNELDDGRSVIADICEIFEDTKEIEFVVSGFGETNWGVDCRFDLPVVIEQLPPIINKLYKNKFNFRLDFSEQGTERELEFKENTDGVNIICISRTGWVPLPNNITISKKDVFNLFNNFYQNFVTFSNVLCNDLANHNLFKEWMDISRY